MQALHFTCVNCKYYYVCTRFLFQKRSHMFSYTNTNVSLSTVGDEYRTKGLQMKLYCIMLNGSCHSDGAGLKG